MATWREVAGLMPLVALNCCLSTAVFAGYVLLITPQHVLADLSAGLPSGASLSLHALVNFVAVEAWFFYAHKAFHDNKRWYAKVHKLHHTWTAPVALATTYTHPAEHLLVNIAANLVGPALCSCLPGGAHPAVAFAWSLLAQVHSFAVHSGYWSDDLGFHDLHHELFSCNYGISGVLDHLHGTFRTKGMHEAAVEARRAARAPKAGKDE